LLQRVEYCTEHVNVTHCPLEYPSLRRWVTWLVCQICAFSWETHMFIKTMCFLWTWYIQRNYYKPYSAIPINTCFSSLRIIRTRCSHSLHMDGIHIYTLIYTLCFHGRDPFYF